MRVLITRAKQDAEPLIQRLQDNGIQTYWAPMINIIQRRIPDTVIHRILTAGWAGQGYLVFTSANGVRSLAEQCAETIQLPCFCVGEQTANAARCAGWQQIYQAAGDVESLLACIIETEIPPESAIFHVRGKDHRGNLVRQLQEKHYSAHAVCAYNALELSELPAQVVHAIKANEVDAVALYSPRTAKIFEHTMQQAHLLDACHRMRIYALSQAVAQELVGDWAGIWYPEPPESAALEAQIYADG